MNFSRELRPLVAVCVTLAISPAVAVPPPSPGAETTAEATPERGTRLQGRAFLGRREGVVGASVVARAQDDSARVYVTSSNSRGAFRLDGLPDGEYEIELRRDGLQPVRKSGVALRFPFRAVVELQMVELSAAAVSETPAVAAADGSAIELAGRVFDEDGRPLPDALLRVVSRDASADPRVFRSGTAGRFATGALPAGAWELDVRGVGYLPIRAVVSLSRDTRVRVTMIRQPADYLPTPLELMPPERALPPPMPRIVEPEPEMTDAESVTPTES